MYYIDATVIPSERTTELLPAHMEFLKKFGREGSFLIFGKNVTTQGHGTIIARASSTEALWNILNQDPLLPGGIEYRVEEFTPGFIAENISDL